MSKAKAVEEINKFNKSLIQLFDGIDKIFHFPTVKKATYMELYTIVWDCCTQSSLAEQTLYATATGREKYFLTAGMNSIGGRVGGGELYYRMENYLIDYVKKLHQMSEKILDDEELVQFYTYQWNRYHSTNNVLRHTLSYLDRQWIVLAYQANFISIREIFTLSMLIWQEYFLKPINNRLIQICLSMIDNERNNHDMINAHLIKDVIDSLMIFNFDHDIRVWFEEEPTTISAMNIYKKWFEESFIEHTKWFYQIQAQKYFNESLITYLTKVARYFNEEEYRIHLYLRLSSTQSFITMIEQILIANRLDDICHEVRNMLNRENYEDLKYLYESIKQMSMTKTKLKSIIKDHIYQNGDQSIKEINDEAIEDPKIYVKTIVEIYSKFCEIIQNVFHNDSIFIDAFNQACAEFINENTITNTGTTSSQLLAQFCNRILYKKNRNLEESEFEKHLNDFMIVFNYIEDKDTFFKFYQRMLAKRLVDQLSASDDYEESMISKLKQACGFEYTSKLQRMFQDIGVSKTLIIEYEKYCETNQVIDIVDFSVMVLSSNSWPFSPSPNFVLPIELKSTFDSFTDFYTHRHNGRKLTWLHQHSKGELQTFFTSQKYILQVSTYQMVILLLFNKVLTWTVERIQDETQIKLELLQQILFGLLKNKLLICTDIHEDELDEDLKDTDIKTNYSIRLATDFKSKKLRINLNVPLKSVEQKDIESAHRTIDEDRKMVIQAAIVRIMKARQTLKHALLMQEVIQQLSSRFRPKIPVIKKCIDILIEKEYLERQSNEKDILRYLA